MRRIAVVLVAATLPLAGIAADQRQADPPEGVDHMIEVVSGETQQVSAAGGTGGTNLLESDDCSSASYDATCEKTLALFKAGGLTTADVTPKYPSDYDLVVYLSDETGALVEEVASSVNQYLPTAPNEAVEFEAKKGKYYLFIVRYFVGGGGYFMNVGLE